MCARLAELQALEADLLALRSRCDGPDAQCHIIEALHQRADAQQQRTHCAGPQLASAMCDGGVMATLPTARAGGGAYACFKMLCVSV